MALKKIFKHTIQPILSVRKWIDFSQWRRASQIGWQTVHDLFSIHSVKNGVSFEDSMQQFGLSENDLISRQQRFQYLTRFWLILGGLVGIYSLYLIVNGFFLSFLYMTALNTIILCQAFRYHFWSFQIKQRRLGCTLQEWWRNTITKGGIF
jgi:intracellular multiplication protein IcmV